MRILFVASEVSPYAKTGGLGDVAGALPAELRSRGHDVITVTPLYDGVDRSGLILRDATLRVDLGNHDITAGVFEDPRTSTLFLDVPSLYGRATLYTDDPDEALRFAALSRLSLAVPAMLDWRPDVIHCNDWQTGLIPAYLRAGAVGELTGTPTLLTIHNLGYQGGFDAALIEDLGLAPIAHLVHQDHLRAGYVGFLETGILHADLVTTVSPTYATEIQTPALGLGLDPLLRERSDDVIGILNGIDTSEWNPLADSRIPFHYSAKSLWRKEWNKEALCQEAGLPYRRHVPVVGIVSRLVDQKGFDYVEGPLVHFLDTWDMRLVVVGTGAPEHEALFRRLSVDYPGQVAFFNRFDVALSHLVEAGSDIFLMPSRYEPCGLNQMYSLAYGTVPVVRRVGGLADTVSPFDPIIGTGNGLVFDDPTPVALGGALGRALTLHLNGRTWRLLQRNGMAVDNSWARRAAEYETAYLRAVGRGLGM